MSQDSCQPGAQQQQGGRLGNSGGNQDVVNLYAPCSAKVLTDIDMIDAGKGRWEDGKMGVVSGPPPKS
jgi:hypothetical protein